MMPPFDMKEPRRRLTPEQMEALVPYEEPLRTMYRSGWARNITTKAFQSLRAIYDAVTGKRNSVSGSCGACIADMLRTLGALYFETRAAEDLEEARKAVRKPARSTRSAGVGKDTGKTAKAAKTGGNERKPKPVARVTVIKTKKIPS